MPSTPCGDFCPHRAKRGSPTCPRRFLEAAPAPQGARCGLRDWPPGCSTYAPSGRPPRSHGGAASGDNAGAQTQGYKPKSGRRCALRQRTQRGGRDTGVRLRGGSRCAEPGVLAAGEHALWCAREPCAVINPATQGKSRQGAPAFPVGILPASTHLLQKIWVKSGTL